MKEYRVENFCNLCKSDRRMIINLKYRKKERKKIMNHFEKMFFHNNFIRNYYLFDKLRDI